MRKKARKILAIICCIAMVLTSFSTDALSAIVAWAQSSGSEPEITITVTENNILASEKFLNIGYSGMPNDYTSGMDFMNASFINEYVTFGGGMTYEDLMEGKVRFYLANSSVLQFNWGDRTEGFTNGWSFTIAEGALLPYMAGDVTKYVALDKEYTFTFCEGADASIYNRVEIAGYKTTTFSLNINPNDPVCNGLSDASIDTNFNITAEGIVNHNTIYQPIQENVSYSEYLEITGVDYADLAASGVELRYILDGNAKVIQMESWGGLRNSLQVGDQIIFHKGFPLYYTDSSGVAWKATLDSDYVYECVVAHNADHDQIFGAVKCDTSYNGYELTTFNGAGAGSQANELYINVDFVEGHTIPETAGISEDLLTEKQAKEYIELPDGDFSDAVFRFIPAANTLQVAFGPISRASLEEGDKIILKKGLSVIYQVGTYAMESATLKESYAIEIDSKTESSMSFNCILYGTYGLGEVFYYSVDAGYADVPYTTGSLSDAQNFEGDIDNEIMEAYFEVSGIENDQLEESGYRLGKYYVPALQGLRIWCDSSDFTLVNGDTIIFKKGLPITYTTTEGKTKTVCLDRDYGYRFNGGNAFVYDSSIVATPEEDDENGSATAEFGVDTLTQDSGAESGNQVINLGITDKPFDFEAYYYKTLSEDATASAYIDFTGCASESTVKNNTVVQFVLASASTQVVQVKFAEAAVNALQVGDKIVLKKGMPVAYSATDAEAVAKLDDNYELVVTAKDGDVITLKSELTGTFSLTENVWYHQSEYMDITYKTSSDLADAQSFSGVALDAEIMKNYLEISDQTYDSLVEKGYGMEAFNIPALRGIRINFETFDLKAGDCVLLKKGLPISYTTAEGKNKTVYLDKTYGYVKNEQTAFIYDALLTEIKPPVIYSLKLNKECSSFEEEGAIKLNLNFADGAIETTQYIFMNLVEDSVAKNNVVVSGYTNQQLIDAGFKILFIPSAGVLQFNLGDLQLKAGDTILLQKGMTISFYDGGAKKAVLAESYEYTVVESNGTYIFTTDKEAAEKGPEIINFGLKEECLSSNDEGDTVRIDLPWATGKLETTRYIAQDILQDPAIQSYIKIGDYTAAELIAKGCRILYIPSAGVLQFWLGDLTFAAGDQIEFVKGLAVSYYDDGDKKAVLDDTYTYAITIEDDGSYYLKRISSDVEKEVITLELIDECASFFEADGSKRINLAFATGSINGASYIYPNLMEDEEIRSYISVDGYTTEQLVKKGFQVLFIPTAGTFQIILGDVKLKDGSEITFKKGMKIVYVDECVREVVLGKNFIYKIRIDADKRYVLNRIMEYAVKVTVDGEVRLNETYREGTKVKLGKYKNTAKGKVMTIKINGVSSQDTNPVVTGDMDIVIENRSDVCVVKYMDGDTVLEVREYPLSTKKVKMPYAPDKDGYDDTWEKFKLKSGVVEVKAVHKERVTKPVVALTKEDLEAEVIYVEEE